MAMNDQISTIIPLVLWSGFFTMCIVQLMKPFTRLYVHRAVLARWLSWLDYNADRRNGANGPLSHRIAFGSIPRSIEFMPSEQYCGYIAQQLTRRHESGLSTEGSAQAPSKSDDPNMNLRALQRVDELLARIKRSLEIAIQIEVLIVSVVVFTVLYRNSAADATFFMRVIALLVAAYSATIFRDLVAIIERLKR